jgi:hypothetical protein
MDGLFSAAILGWPMAFNQRIAGEPWSDES